MLKAYWFSTVGGQEFVIVASGPSDATAIVAQKLGEDDPVSQMQYVGVVLNPGEVEPIASVPEGM